MDEALPSGTVTFLFTDIEASTEHARKLGPRFAELRSTHHSVLRAGFEQYGGHELDTAGDGFFVAFERAADAVGAAVAVQRVLHESELTDEHLRVRMGIHTAEPFFADGAYLGVGVHRAARICAAAHGGQILLSNATAGIVEDLDLPGVELRDLGEHRLKDIERPQRLFQIDVDGLPSAFPSLRTADAADSRAAILTLLYADLVGWADVLRTLGDEAAAEVARAYHGIVIGVINGENGRATEMIADNILAMFERPRDALRAAVRIREALRAEPWALELTPPEVRIAVHSGRVPDPTARSVGSAAITCSSLCATAEPGQILVSHATEALLEGELPELSIRDLGERTVGRRDRAAHVFEVA